MNRDEQIEAIRGALTKTPNGARDKRSKQAAAVLDVVRPLVLREAAEAIIAMTRDYQGETT